MVHVLTIAGAVSSLLVAALMLLSATSSEFRFWPPGRVDWRYWAYVLLTGIPSVALVTLAVFDDQSFVFSGTGWWWIGILSVAVGSAGFLAAMFDLGLVQSTGLEGDLNTGGLYRYSRNPQLVCLIVLVAGAVLAINSPRAAVVGSAMLAWLVSMPFAEEPWLRDQFGETYAEYLDRVPRFVGGATIRRLVADLYDFELE